MPDYTAARIDDMETMYWGAMRRARATLGVTSFGMQIIDMPPNANGHPEHDHAESGQEEVYIVLRGSAEIDVDGERTTLDPDTLIRVGPAARRKVYSGPEGVRLLCLGGVPGGVYEAWSATELGAPDPAVR
jgi:mannose-6-phosphate isomerase-like protein (cupin superfamily)